jgi:hypothetical protein
MTKVGVGPFQFEKTYFFKTGLSKIRNLEHKYGTTKTQLPKKVDGT